MLAARPDEMLAAPAGERSGAGRGRACAPGRAPGVPNGLLSAAQVDAQARLDATASAFLKAAAAQLSWSGRRLHRVIKVARTIVDLAGAEGVATAHIVEALQWQRVLGT